MPAQRRGALSGRRGDESGLTGPQWLLAAAAVAALVALGVVVAGNLDSSTSGTAASGSYRADEATRAAAAVVEEAKGPHPLGDARWATWSDWESHFTAECDRVKLIYSDVVIRAISNFEPPPIRVGSEPQAAELQKATDAPPAGNTPQAQCEVMLP